MKQLRCPHCKMGFDAATIEDGKVMCPHCRAVMFVYRQPGEQLTPAEFVQLIDTRGREAGKAAMAWMPHKSRLGQAQAAMRFIIWIWPQLAMIFKPNEEGTTA